MGNGLTVRTVKRVGIRGNASPSLTRVDELDDSAAEFRRDPVQVSLGDKGLERKSEGDKQHNKALHRSPMRPAFHVMRDAEVHCALNTNTIAIFRPYRNIPQSHHSEPLWRNSAKPELRATNVTRPRSH